MAGLGILDRADEVCLFGVIGDNGRGHSAVGRGGETQEALST